jgi:hypothetical protein
MRAVNLVLTDSERKSLTTALLYAREIFAVAPAHWMRPGVMADVETIVTRVAPIPRHGQESKLGFPGSGDARRHVSKLLEAPSNLRENKVSEITATYIHVINASSVESRGVLPRVSFQGHDDKARAFLFKAVRGYMGPKHPLVTHRYARKIENLARANGFTVTVVKEPKPTPAECDAIRKRVWDEINASLVQSAAPAKRGQPHHERLHQPRRGRHLLH